MFRIAWHAEILLIIILLFSGCAPVVPDAPVVPSAPAAPEVPAPVAPAETPPAVAEQPALSEDEILSATQIVYDSYMALIMRGETPLSPEEETACREQFFTNMQQADWFSIPYEDADEFWAENCFAWLCYLLIDEESELPYLLLPYGSTDGYLSDSYFGTLARQFMIHPRPLLKLVAAHKDWQYLCGGISYGSYPLELAMYSLLREMQAGAPLTQAEQDAISLTLERMTDLYGSGDTSWAENSLLN